ncbi:aggregation-promoting factor C-terminal-like domain-containing protein [Jatrophihabitans fulvus]
MLRSLKYGLYGAVLSGLVAAPVVIWNATGKDVTLLVDGKARQVSTSASDVGDLLSDEGFETGSHDIVAPTADTAVKDGMKVVLNRGKQLVLRVDGRTVKVWTTAPTVSDALAQLGYSQSDFVSVSRSKRLPVGTPTSIDVRTPRTVTVVHDGEREKVSTTEPTVGDMLQQLGVSYDANDRLSVPAAEETEDGLTVVLKRVSTRTAVRTETVGYDTTKRRSGAVYQGTTQVLKPGRKGRAQVTYSVVYVDGKPVGRTRTGVKIVVPARDRVVLIGTKEPTGPAGAQAIARQLLPRFGFDDSEFGCLVQMWNRESGWNTSATNPSSGAYGIPQSLPGNKMASAGPAWQSDARTQIMWGLGYIKDRYSTPCGAWSFWQAHNYY